MLNMNNINAHFYVSNLEALEIIKQFFLSIQPSDQIIKCMRVDYKNNRLYHIIHCFDVNI